MQISAEILMAYADGELDETTAAQVDLAIRDDAQLAARVAAHRALRERLQTAFAEDLHEPVPQRLVDAAHRSRMADGGVPAAAAFGGSRARARRRWWRAPLPLAVAASVGLGIGIGVFIWRSSGERLQRNAQGALVADARLAHALSHELSGPGGTSGVDVVLSFVSRNGEYCRAFRLTGSEPRSGLACRRGAHWRIDALARAVGGQGRDSGYRTAGSSLPPAVLRAIQSRRVGQPLDRAGEMAARDRGWSAPPRH
ncbi:MAG: hypothetical protein KGL36_13730 [Gammaproteobacteria bacterium]|nr:hypothetical protein [Gammaproteobacteria bacterium]